MTEADKIRKAIEVIEHPMTFKSDARRAIAEALEILEKKAAKWDALNEPLRRMLNSLLDDDGGYTYGSLDLDSEELAAVEKFLEES